MNAGKKIALVTGAGTGIGRAAALALGEAGFTVVLNGRRREPLEAVASEIAGETLVAPADISRPDEVAALFATVKETYGRLDLLFNNAGGGLRATPIEDISLEEWQNVVNVNLTGVFVCIQHAVRMMKAQEPKGGRIINNGSISAHSPRPMAAPYTTTKHAITGLTKQVALDGRAHSIACGQIDIGNADTPLTVKFKDGVPQPNGTVAPEPTFDVAHAGKAVAYMASLPLDTNVLFMTIMATTAPFIGRG